MDFFFVFQGPHNPYFLFLIHQKMLAVGKFSEKTFNVVTMIVTAAVSL